MYTKIVYFNKMHTFKFIKKLYLGTTNTYPKLFMISIWVYYILHIYVHKVLYG